MNAIIEQDRSGGSGVSFGKVEPAAGEAPRRASPAEQVEVYRRRTRLPAGLTEDELMCGYARHAVEVTP